MNESSSTSRQLEGVVIAFDIDNTLLSPHPNAYRHTIDQYLSFHDIGLLPEEAYKAHEKIRAMGNALEAIGLPNSIHHRGTPETLALYLIGYASDKFMYEKFGLNLMERCLSLEWLNEVSELIRTGCEGDWHSRFTTYIEYRNRVKRPPATLVDPVRIIAESKLVQDWSATYADAERDNVEIIDFAPLMRKLQSLGANLVIITEGRYALQSEKLNRIGLAELFKNRILVTESAARPDGIEDIERIIANAIETGTQAEELLKDQRIRNAWGTKLLTDAWAGKSPAFFARCLHAIAARPAAPQQALSDSEATVNDEHWQTNPTRFVMVGDRYEKDIEPLIELLGPGGCTTIRLTQGRYGRLHPLGELEPHRRPTHTFEHWDALHAFLTTKLHSHDVPVIDVAPSVIHEKLIEQNGCSPKPYPMSIGSSLF